MAGGVARMVMVMHVHVDLGRAEDPLHHLAPLQRPAGKVELGEFVPERLERHARVDEGAHDHVPRGPARAVEIRDAHLYLILLASLLIWLACAAAPYPLSMFTTDTPGAQELSMARSAATPPKEAP